MDMHVVIASAINKINKEISKESEWKEYY
jgi:hypothetical protein